LRLRVRMDEKGQLSLLVLTVSRCLLRICFNSHALLSVPVGGASLLCWR